MLPLTRENELLRRLPSVDDVLRSAAGVALLSDNPRWAVVAAARAEIDERRRALRSDPDEAPRIEEGIEASTLAARVERLQTPSLRRVVNATGVVLHTNLGRAPLPARALARVQEIARGYSNLEYDTAGRERGSRHAHVEELLTAVTGAEAAAVVNNNASAVLVALAALAGGRRAIVSRGELVEIGGGFRIPDVMRWSGVDLTEVGTTNKTRLSDYVGAIGPETALLLKVHRSNFAVVGFTEEASLAELVGAARPRGLPVMVDLGSGSLIDLAPLGLPGEPTVGVVVRQGADVCTFSGDKLLGGPQAGILVGRREAMARVLAHPLMRAVRPDKMTLAALEATLEIYREGDARAVAEIPALRMLAARPEALAARKDRLLAALDAAMPDAGAAPMVAEAVVAEAVAGRSAVGGGALPLVELDSWAIALGPRGIAAEELARALAAGEPPVIARIAADRVLLDLRTVADDEVAQVADAVARACRACTSEEAATARRGGRSR